MQEYSPSLEMKLLLPLLLILFQATCSDAAGVKFDVYGMLGCKKGGKFEGIEGIKMFLYEFDPSVFDPDDLLNETVSNAQGRFRLQGGHTENFETPDVYVWVSLRCDFVLNETKLFEGCNIWLDPCKYKPSLKIMYTKLHLTYRDPYRGLAHKWGVDKCALDINIGDFRVEIIRPPNRKCFSCQMGGWMNEHPPQTEKEKVAVVQKEVATNVNLPKCEYAFRDMPYYSPPPEI